MNEMIALGIPDNWITSVKLGKGYKVTLYEHPGFTGRSLVLTTDAACLIGDNFHEIASGIRVERLEGQSTACSPGAGSTSAVATITNYGTFQMQHPVFATGTKLYNYGSLQIGNFSLPSNSELHNFNSVSSTFFEVTTSALVYSKAASRIDADNLELRGSIEGDAYNYSSLTTTNTTVHTSGSIEGLLKLCTRQNLHEYGSVDSRVVKDCSFSIPVLQQRTASLYRSEQGRKVYELSNHLGNVLTTISDRRIGVAGSNPAMIDYYTSVLLSSQDYYAFGWEMPGRGHKGSNDYRYGFNGKELDKENSLYDYGFRIYDPRIGKFLSVDPLMFNYPFWTPYQFASNTPIQAIDLDGNEYYHYLLKLNENGNVIGLIFEGKNLSVLEEFSLPTLLGNKIYTVVVEVNGEIKDNYTFTTFDQVYNFAFDKSYRSDRMKYGGNYENEQKKRAAEDAEFEENLNNALGLKYGQSRTTVSKKNSQQVSKENKQQQQTLNKSNEIGKSREQLAADMSEGVIAKHNGKDMKVTIKNADGTLTSATLDVLGKNGEYITVGGAAKANKLSSWGDHLTRLRKVATANKTVAQAYLDENSPKELIEFTQKRLGNENVIILKSPQKKSE